MKPPYVVEIMFECLPDTPVMYMADNVKCEGGYFMMFLNNVKMKFLLSNIIKVRQMWGEGAEQAWNNYASRESSVQGVC